MSDACLYYSDCWSLSLLFTSFDALYSFLEGRLGKGGFLVESGAEGHTVYRNLDHALQAKKAMAEGTYEYAYDRPTATVKIVDAEKAAFWKSHGVEVAA